MSWTESIVRAFFVAFGISEVISNTHHLLQGDVNKIANSARKQHGEIPIELADKHFVYKASIMLIFGVAFLVAGLMMYMNKSFSHGSAITVMSSFGFYGVVQGIIYRKSWKSILAAGVYNLPLIIYLIYS